MKQIEYNNIQYIVGQNAQDNWNIFDNYLSINPLYIWFHLNSFSSPYVIMCCTLCDLKENPDYNNYLQYGATLCKQYSKYTYLNDLKIVYTSLKNLHKGNKIGEIIIKGKKHIIKI